MNWQLFSFLESLFIKMLNFPLRLLFCSEARLILDSTLLLLLNDPSF